MKLVADASPALVLFNRSESAPPVVATFSDLGIHDVVPARDLSARKEAPGNPWSGHYRRDSKARSGHSQRRPVHLGPNVH
jgi:hypothetical protein